MLAKRLTAILVTVCMISASISPLSGLKAIAQSDDSFQLYDGGTVAKIYVDTDAAGVTEYKQVVRAANDLKKDIEAVTSKSPDVVSKKQDAVGKVVIAGTLGKSDLIDELVSSGKLDASEIAGQWEAFAIRVIENPFAGCDSALVIAGSDKRGTIYGIYELSQMIGVSPWYWWGDVPIEKKSSVILKKEDVEKTEKPDVKYRGIFINDEKNFTNWSAKFQSSTSPGTPNPDTYAKVFELLLRLKANTLWPAMHNYSTGFNVKVNPNTGKPYNAELADEYGIVMGASHCEILLRDNEAEWEPWCEANKNNPNFTLTKVNNSWRDSYDYTVNPEAMNQYWEDRVAVNYKYDNLYTIGLRGLHDSEILHKNLANPTTENKAAVVKRAVEAQIAILRKYEQKYYEETGERKVFDKVFCAYKEAAEYFKYDLSIPEETYILWADDNYGYVRAVSDNNQLSKYQGAGVYYHISYWGRPDSYLWVASTPLRQIYSEMSKAYNAGSDDVFILNVGDIKPGEIPMEFFLSMGWDADEYNENTIDNFIKKIAKRDYGFSDTQANELADILNRHYQITVTRRPETQGKNKGTEYSIINYGDEAQRVINEMVDLTDRSQALMDSLDESKKTAYYQMVHYMIRVSRYSFEKSYYQKKNQLYYTQGRFASVNAYAKASSDAYNTLLSDVNYYNNLSNGKWKDILNPYVSGIPQPEGALKLTYVSEAQASDGVGSVCEGQTTGSENVTLDFNSLTDDQRFIDVFNKGKSTAAYKIVADKPIKIITSGDTVLSHKVENGKNVYTGTVEVEDRVWAAVDWNEAQKGKQTANITVSDNFGESKTYTAVIVKAEVNPDKEKEVNNGYYETNGEVSIEAEHYTNNVEVNGQKWVKMPGLGRSGDAMKVIPDLSANTIGTRIDSDFENTSPYLEYKIYFESTGNFILTMYRLPTLNEGDGRTCRTAVQFDNGTISLLRGNSYADDSDTSAWAMGVLNNIEALTLSTPFNVATPGWHTLRVYKSDAGIVIDKLVLRKESQAYKASLLGAPESFNTILEYKKSTLAKGPAFSLENLTFVDSSFKYYYDFTNDTANVAAGYTGIDNKVQKAALKYYEWDAEGFDKINAVMRSVEKTSLRDNGIVYSSNPAGINFKMSESGKYLVSLAIGDRLPGGISVSNMNVSANGVEVIKNLNHPSGSTIEKAFIVDVSESKTIELDLSGSWVLAAVEITPYNEAQTNNGYLNFIPDKNGNINIEAEAANENSDYAQNLKSTDNSGHEWTLTTGISGYGMFAGPNSDKNYNNTNMASNNGAKLKYKIDFKSTGNYNVWVLVKSQCADDDSLLISLDSDTPLVLNDFTDTQGSFKWLNAGRISVSSAGVKTLTVCEREDGLVLDKIVITKSYNSPSGTGGVMTRDKDLTQLQAAYETAKALLGNKYSDADRQALNAAYQKASAVLANENATKAEIEEAVEQLESVIQNLPPVSASSIKIKGVPSYIKAGKSVKLSTEISPSNALDKSVKWSSGNTKVATVSQNGTVTGKKAGKAVITAKLSNGIKAKVTVIVKGEVSKVTVKKPLYKLKANQTLKLSSIIKSESPGKEYRLQPKYTLSVDKKYKKYVSIKGTKIKTLKKGKGKTITVTIKNNGKKVGSFKIKIK